MPHSERYCPHRILMTADTLGGVWTYAIEMAHALAPHHVEIVLATMGGQPSDRQIEDAAAARNLRLYTSNYALEWMQNPWRDVDAAGEWLLDLEREVQPDLVHLNGFVHAALPFRAPVLVVAHSCVLSWFAAVHGTRPPAEWDEYRGRVRRGLHAAGAVTALTSFMLSELRRYYGFVAVEPPIYNARRQAPFHSRPREPFVLCVGRVWDQAKNVQMLDDVAPRLAWPVYVAGEQRHPDGGGRTCLRNAVPLGMLSARELAEWYSRAGIFAHPALYEPFGLAALEAALSGAALVLGDIPSLREVWADAACYVDPRDPAAWRAALTGLMHDSDERQNLANRALARARRYSLPVMADAYLRLYGQLARPATAPARPGAQSHQALSRR